MKLVQLLSITLVTSLLIMGCAERKDAVSSSGGDLVLISRTPVQGSAKSVAVAHNHAYVADEPVGISVYNILDPAQPLLVDTFDFPPLGGNEADLIAVDSTDQIGCIETARLFFFDTENGAIFGERGSGNHAELKLFFDGNALDVFRCDSDETDGFNYETFINTGTPEDPAFVFNPSYFSRYFGNDFSVYGFDLNDASLAYVTRNTTGFAIVDYSTGQLAEIQSETNTIGKIRDAALADDNILCLAAGYEGILTYDVSDPQNPEFLGSLIIQFATDIEWIEVTGDRAVLLDDNDGVYLVDISNPEAPSLTGEVEISDPNGFCVNGDYIYVADEDMGLVICQILN